MWDDDTHRWVPMGPRPVDYSPEARQARWVVRLLATSVFVVVVAAVFFVTVAVSRDGAPRPLAGDPATGGPAATGLPVAAPGVGPAPGADVGSYVDARRRELAVMPASDTGTRLSVVSLREYRTETDARQVVHDAEIKGFLVAAPGGSPTLVTDGLAAWSARQRQADVEEREAIAALIPSSANDPNFQAFYRQEVARLDKAIAAASATSPVVFAVVVSGPAAALGELARGSGVRLVDIGPAGLAGEAGNPVLALRGLRPEEQVTAGEPPIRPVEAA